MTRRLEGQPRILNPQVLNRLALSEEARVWPMPRVLAD
jgi:hypothetical protein